MYATGGGKSPEPLSATEERLSSLLEKEFQPLRNKFDSGADYHNDNDDNGGEIIMSGLSDNGSDTTNTANDINKTINTTTVDNENCVSPSQDVNYVETISQNTTRDKQFSSEKSYKRKRPVLANTINKFADYLDVKKSRTDEKTELELNILRNKQKTTENQVQTSEYEKETKKLELEMTQHRHRLLFNEPLLVYTQEQD